MSKYSILKETKEQIEANTQNLDKLIDILKLWKDYLIK